jgi:hypothetical protein
MELLLFACTESAAIDAGTNRLSLFHVLEELHVTAFPISIPIMCVVVLLERLPIEPAQNTILFELKLDGNPAPLIVAPININFQSHLRARAVGQIQGLTIPAPGTLRATIGLNQVQLGSWKIEVSQIGQPQLTVQPTAPPPSTQAASPPPKAPRRRQRRAKS